MGTLSLEMESMRAGSVGSDVGFPLSAVDAETVFTLPGSSRTNGNHILRIIQLPFGFEHLFKTMISSARLQSMKRRYQMVHLGVRTV